MMKPVRGSARVSSKPPTVKNTTKKKTQKHKQHTAETPQDSEPGPSAPKSTKKKKKEGEAPSAPIKPTGQKQWKPLPASSVSALDNILDMSILSALYTRKTDVKEVQKHLNLMKNRFLAECKQLKVPIQRPSDFSCSSRQRQEQTKTASANKSDLRSLERSVETVVSTLETMEEQQVSLEHRCGDLMEQLEEEKEKAREIFHIPEQGLLNLPSSLPTLRPSEATLQEQMVRMIPDTDSVTTARRLGGILLKSAQLQDVQALLIHAHKHADQSLGDFCHPFSPLAYAFLALVGTEIPKQDGNSIYNDDTTK